MFLLRSLLVLHATLELAAGVAVQFDPASPKVGPFPNDGLTVHDPAQRTGRRVSLPLPDCTANASTCEDIAVVNRYDGFSLTPRIVVKFSGNVRAETLHNGIFLLALDNVAAEQGRHATAAIIGINQLLWDAGTATLYANPDEILDQHRRYALIVTTAVQDVNGESIQVDPAFQACMDRPSNVYCWEVGTFVWQMNQIAERVGAHHRIAAASIFTTMSATAWVESARDRLSGMPPRFSRPAARSVFAAGDISTIVTRQQTRSTPGALEDSPVRLDYLKDIGRIAFGSYWSPNYLNERRVIEETPTAREIGEPNAVNEIHFQATLPAATKPAAGYPVVLIAPGRGGNRFFPFSGLAQTMAGAGYATVSINPVGHGFGAASRIVLTERNGATTELSAGGRGVDVNGDGTIGGSEGCLDFRNALGFRDCARQTTVDMIQLVRAIRAGMDLDGDGTRDLDPDRIYFLGFSMGANFGTLLMAVEPAISSGVLSAAGGSSVAFRRMSPGLWTELSSHLRSRTPAVAPNAGMVYQDHYVFRGQPVQTVEADSTVEIADILELLEWIEMPGDAIAYAPHLRSAPLQGVSPKRVLLYMARGDQSVPNPAASNWSRSADLQSWTVMYRHDLARSVVPSLPANAHGFLTLLTSPESTLVALHTQRQAAAFLSSGERCGWDDPCLLDINADLRPAFGRDLFESPATLPDDLGFLVP